MRSQLLTEISRSGRRRWLQVDEMPFSRAITYKLIGAGLISSVEYLISTLLRTRTNQAKQKNPPSLPGGLSHSRLGCPICCDRETEPDRLTDHPVVSSFV
jgi:hypothetical protein